jgi:hypothetical protein
VGGVPASQHLHGCAVELAQPATSWQEVRRLNVFSGIGFIRANGLALHCDVRHVCHNPTGGTPERPTVWSYA